MSATPEQLRTAAQVVRDDSMGAIEFSALCDSLPARYADALRELRWTNHALVLDAVALSLELDALRLDQDAAIKQAKGLERTNALRLEHKCQIADIVRKHWSAS